MNGPLDPQEVARQLPGLWQRIKKCGLVTARVVECLPDAMPPKAGNPRRLAELILDAELEYEEVDDAQ